jgi:hypothetical protein
MVRSARKVALTAARTLSRAAEAHMISGPSVEPTVMRDEIIGVNEEVGDGVGDGVGTFDEEVGDGVGTFDEEVGDGVGTFDEVRRALAPSAEKVLSIIVKSIKSASFVNESKKSTDTRKLWVSAQ